MTRSPRVARESRTKLKCQFNVTVAISEIPGEKEEEGVRNHSHRIITVRSSGMRKQTTRHIARSQREFIRRSSTNHFRSPMSDSTKNML